ncbi:terpene synthase family protein [Actinacidiphila sp. ITFR-21]|uniref:terpene synthase family protein n=1 Tax=Actinacidiphila sp. ITFR-21 TaxID=3075199 RepID=UPI00288BE757|nr:hypothetical protein [Streptomyces sp. ITFR-21]WNI14222.1 hypothetical protein RLT57_00880 [Streptomyces sp. ITFR-21]
MALPPERYQYPSFRMPVFPRFTPARRRPGLETLEQRCVGRLAAYLRDAFEDQEKLEAFLEHRTSLWNLLVYADTREDRVELICAWIDVLFCIDDVFVQAAPARLRELGLYELSAVIDGRQPAFDTAFTRAFRQLRENTLPLAPAGTWQRCARNLHEFLDACTIERDLAQDLTALDLPTYEKYRTSSVGECCFPLLELGLGIDLSGPLEKLSELRRLNVLVARHWIGVNDIFSYRKELYSGDTMNEIQLALGDNGGDLQAAVDRVAATVHRVEAEFDRLTTTLRAGAPSQDSSLRTYLDALETMIAGNLEWSYLTPRYNGRGHTWNGLTDATVVLTPDRTLYLPR